MVLEVQNDSQYTNPALVCCYNEALFFRGGDTLRDSAGTLAESLSRMSFAAKTL